MHASIHKHFRRALAVAVALGLLAATGCMSLLLWYIKPGRAFDPALVPPAPDYSKQTAWAALPQRQDDPDTVPSESSLKDNQASAPADVFFVHPTTYLGNDGWNAAIGTPVAVYGLRPLALQASVFNGSAKIYAPRYRQATLYAFVENGPNAAAAFAVAQRDVEAAFEYYLKHFNQGRPYFIAGHSQGSKMLIKVLQKHLDQGKPDPRFIAAYLPGWSIKMSAFQHLKACASATQRGCFIAWNSKQWGTQPSDFELEATRYEGGSCVNPLTWKQDELPAGKEAHLGAVGKDFRKIQPKYVEARCHGESLWVRLPQDDNFESSRDPRNYHIVDYNLFYLDIRKNIAQRLQTYLSGGAR